MVNQETLLLPTPKPSKLMFFKLRSKLAFLKTQLGAFTLINDLWQLSCLLCPLSFHFGFLFCLRIIADSWTCLLFTYLPSSMWVIPVYMHQIRHVQVLAESRPCNTKLFGLDNVFGKVLLVTSGLKVRLMAVCFSVVLKMEFVWENIAVV